MRKKLAAQTPLAAAVPAPEPAGPLPLSFAQESLWFFEQLVPNSPLYNIPRAFRLTGELNIPALQKAFCEIVRRHEILRATFVMAEGRPVQKVSPAGPFALPVVDLADDRPQ